MPRVDPTEQGLDEPVDDGLPEPGCHVLPHRDVLLESPSRPFLLVPESLDLVVREHATG